MTRKKNNNTFKITPKNRSQQEFVNSMIDNPVTFAIGSAGSGKTFLAAAKALEYLDFSFVDRIVIVRPAVATEKLGFLPGDLEEKLDPYLMPLMDAFTTLSDPKRVQDLRNSKEIEVAPLAFMRGRTFSNAFLILDEAQNSTIDQMRMFLTRFGENVKVVVTGDLSQSDLGEENGLKWAMNLLEPCSSVNIVRFTNKDVVRSELVKDILKYIDNDKSTQNTKRRISEVIRSTA